VWRNTWDLGQRCPHLFEIDLPRAWHGSGVLVIFPAHCRRYRSSTEVGAAHHSLVQRPVDMMHDTAQQACSRLGFIRPYILNWPSFAIIMTFTARSVFTDRLARRMSIKTTRRISATMSATINCCERGLLPPGHFSPSPHSSCKSWKQGYSGR